MKLHIARSFPIKITLYYFLISIIWEIISDNLSHLLDDLNLVDNPWHIKTYLLIMITGFVLYKLILSETIKRKKVEEALAEAEEKYRSIVEDAFVGVYLFQDGKCQYVNPRYEQITGYSLEDLQQISILDRFPEDKDQLTKDIQKLLSGEITKMHTYSKGLGKYNNIIEFEVIRSRTIYNGRPAIIGTVLDVTERKRTEELLRNAEKLSVVGELAAGIAHEIRNPLTSLRGFIQIYQKDDIDEKHKLHYEVMLSEINRINGIVSELLVLAKPTKETYSLRDVCKKLDQVITLFEGQSHLYNVEVIKAFDKELPSIHCQSNLKQVFINIFKNALESMPNGGELLIQANRTEDHVRIRFTDQGCGIPKELLSKIGRPFYTTKESGTGLGLMVSQRIIQNHKGTIHFESEEGRGTTVEILLPVNNNNMLLQ